MQSITRAVIRIARRRFDELDRVGGSAQQGGTAIPFPSSADHIGSITGIVGADVAEYLTQADKNRIAAIDWLVHDPAQRGEALVLGNSLLRLFIAMRKLGAARAVLDRLPLAILDQLKLKLLRAEEEFGAETTRAAVPPWLANTVREHECLLLYLQACVRCSYYLLILRESHFDYKRLIKITPSIVNNFGLRRTKCNSSCLEVSF